MGMITGEMSRIVPLTAGIPIVLPPNAVAVLTTSAIRSATADFLKILDERSKRVVIRRFGLDGEGLRTLHAIGIEEGVTRERIRQVEQAILKLFRSEKRNSTEFTNIKKVQDALLQVIAFLGGVVREELLCELLGLKTKADSASLGFLLKSLQGVTGVRESNRYKSYFRHEVHVGFEKIIVAAREILNEKKSLLSDADLFGKVRERCAINSSNPIIFSVLLIAHDLVRTPFGQWGIRGWVEATPRGVGDKAYVVLKRDGEPMHFLKITDFINGAKFDGRIAHPQTVHNELIRDERFILVGRGMYALKEWGYRAGTVGDVLERIIKENKENSISMNKEDLIEEVLKERIVKRNTILLALQNRKRFVRDAQGLYAIVAFSTTVDDKVAMEKQKQIINNDGAVDPAPKTEDFLGGNA
ncbi:MAG: sigma factor-like helix-turn-helix DNA-binding protein [bacterium]|nr:sigma factor-like helix-turn-helix DNA-binding protein [bacterium]